MTTVAARTAAKPRPYISPETIARDMDVAWGLYERDEDVPQTLADCDYRRVMDMPCLTPAERKSAKAQVKGLRAAHTHFAREALEEANAALLAALAELESPD